MKIGCVIMASGFGRRFGGNKLSQTVDGVSLIEHALSAVPAEKFEKVVVVTQYPQITELAEKHGFIPLYNAHPEHGQSESIHIGLQALQDCDGILFQVADQPKLQKESVASLVDFFCEYPGKIVALSHEGHRGNPCLFPARFFSELMDIKGDHGGNVVIHAHKDDLLLWEVNSIELSDVDTPEQLKKL